jgi:hypothetical protein
VVTVTSLAHLLGPKWSGLIAAFPVNTLPVIVILHRHYGSDVAFLGLERLGPAPAA